MRQFTGYHLLAGITIAAVLALGRWIYLLF